MRKQDSPEGTVIFGSPEDVHDAPKAKGEEGQAEAPIDETAPLYPGVPWEPAATPLQLESPAPADSTPGRLADPPPPEPPSEPRVPGFALRELESLVREALAKYAAIGELRVTPRQISLDTPIGTTRFTLGTWMESWPRLSLAEREDHAREIARRLQGEVAKRRDSGRPPVRVDLRIVGAVVFLLGLSAFLYFDSRSNSFEVSDRGGSPDDPTLPASGRASTNETETRARRVCAETRARIHQGGSVTVADAEGWLVEVQLLAEGKSGQLAKTPALKNFFTDPSSAKGSKYQWPDAKLSTLDTSDTKVRIVGYQLENANSEESIPGITFSFGGALVDAYFNESQRGEYYRIAHALAESVGATHGALYARCAHEKTHALGSWFLGANAAKASSSLVYFMGIYARPRHVSRSYTHAVGADTLDPLLAFRSVEKATEHLDRAALATLAGSQGGMATGKEGDAVVISFPFRDGNRASRTSRNIARVTSLED